MPSEDKDNVSAEAIRAAAEQMIRAAFHHMKTVPVGALPLIQELFKYEEHTQDMVPDCVLAAISGKGQCGRLQTPAGPFVFVRPDEKEPYAGHYVPSMIVADNVDLRRASIEYLTAGMGTEPWLSPDTIHVIRENRSRIESTNVNTWVSSACQVENHLDGDFLVHVAGLRQLMHCGLARPTINEWSQVLLPSCGSLLSTKEDRYDVIVQLPKVAEEIAQSVSVSGCLAHLLAYYRNHLGHLPFNAPYDWAEIMSQYAVARQMPPEELWKEYGALLNSTQDDVSTYHLLAGAMAKPELLPKKALIKILRRAVAYVHLISTDQKSPERAELNLRSVLARYYMLYLELQVPQLETQRVLTCSWWAADRVVNCLLRTPASRPSAEEIHAWIEKRIAPFAHRLELLHLLAGPAVPPSLARLLTLHLGIPWGMSLVSIMLNRLGSLPTSDLTEEEEDAASTTIVACLWLGYLRGRDESKSGGFQFDDCSFAAARKWHSGIRDSLTQESIGHVLAMVEPLYTPAGISECLTRYDQLTAVERASLFSALRAQAVAGELPLSHILQNADRWFPTVVRDSTPLEQQCLSEALVTITRRDTSEARLSVPHLWARGAEERGRASDAHRFMFCVWNVIASCIATTSFSALRRLVANRELRQMLEQWDIVKKNLDALSESATPELRGWLREATAIMDLV